MKYIVEDIFKKIIYIICENSDEAIDIKDTLIDAGIYSTTPTGFKNWYIRVDMNDLSDYNICDLKDIFEDLK